MKKNVFRNGLVLGIIFLLLGASVVLVNPTVKAGTTVYANRPGWESAVGLYYEEFFTDATLNPGVSVVSDNGYVHPAGYWWDRVDDGDWGDPGTTTWSFSFPITAWGGTFNAAGPGGPGSSIVVELVDGTPVYVGTIPNTIAGTFWGFVSDTPFVKVHLKDAELIDHACETYTMDNMVYSTGGNQLPVAKFSYSPGSPWTTDIIQFSDKSTDKDGTITSWHWNFGDGTTSTNQNPTHQYSVAGKYTVSLTVTDDDGASRSTSLKFEVSNPKKPGDSGVINVALKSNGASISGQNFCDPQGYCSDVNEIIDGITSHGVYGGFWHHYGNPTATVTLCSYSNNYRLVGIGWKIAFRRQDIPPTTNWVKVQIQNKRNNQWYQIGYKDNLAKDEVWNAYEYTCSDFYRGPQLPAGFNDGDQIKRIELIGYIGGSSGGAASNVNSYEFYEIGVWVEEIDDLIVTSKCPVDLILTDPLGRLINKTYSEIPNATYTEYDVDDDGYLDDQIYVPRRLNGEYSIMVEPEPGASPTDTYSILVYSEKENFYLAQDIMISDIPDDPYTIEPGPPETIKTVGNPKSGDNDEWVDSSTEFNLTATDDISGVDKTYYRIWYSGLWDPEPGTGAGIYNNYAEYTGNFTLAGEGKHYIEYYSIDNAGNVEEIHNQTHYINKAPPVADAGGPYETEEGTEIIFDASGSHGGYSYSVIYDWVDATTLGVRDPYLSTSNDSYTLWNLGFTFNFYGNDYTQVYIGTNGYLTFGTGYTQWNNQGSSLPSTSVPPNMIAPAFFDICPWYGGDIYVYKDLTSSPKKFVVEWHQCALYSLIGSNTMEAILYETGIIKFQYGYSSINWGQDWVGHYPLVGIQNQDRTIGVEYKDYVDQSLFDGLAIEFFSSGDTWIDNTIIGYHPITCCAWDFDDDGVYDYQETSNDAPDGLFDGKTTHTYGDNDIYTRTLPMTLQVTDDTGATDTDSCTVTVNNVNPTIESMSGPMNPMEIDTEVPFTGTFTDSGLLDTHTATIVWDDGTTSAGIVTETDGSGTVDGSHYYDQPGVYTITLTVRDDDGGTDSMTLSYYVVVYDPEDGFVTGGGWINSPEGAYTPDPSLTGKANFGFVAKYKKGQQNPTGNTEFQFQVADMNFHSDSYDWLVIAGAKAMYKGTGTINNAGNYGFMLSAIDEDLTPSTDVDLFRIKIWDKDNNDIVIYDNKLGEEEDADPTTQIGGGQIVIHKS